MDAVLDSLVFFCAVPSRPVPSRPVPTRSFVRSRSIRRAHTRRDLSRRHAQATTRTVIQTTHIHAFERIAAAAAVA
jgi:hypothetical protein